MKQFLKSTTISVGLAVFSMLFGAGNLIYPILVGMTTGDKHIIGIIGFLLTAVCLPIAGLITMIFFNGNYYEFFNRLGKIPGKICVFLCMLIIGPVVAIPRIITLSHIMIAPFLPIEMLRTISLWSSFIFSCIFLGFTFLGSYRKRRIVNLLGHFISPLLLISLLIIIIKGFFTAESTFANPLTAFSIFKENLMRGYETLDLFGTIFFASIILAAIAQNGFHKTDITNKQRAIIGLKAGILGGSILAFIYAGINYLGAFHGSGIVYDNAGELFREVSFKIFTHYGAIIISIAVAMACYSTAITLAAVIASYLQREIFNNRITFIQSLIIVLLTCIPLSTAGLSTVLRLTGGPISYIGYPVLIVLTFLNLAYKLWGFKPVKIPILLTFIVMFIFYLL
ncbi:hypothetical protein E3J79_04175 [Candidatus Dependentiae bacterium]|nr:MAG: hypothetical protein E3J79_04175 [Candidatus Dependentiae bacterium]